MQKAVQNPKKIKMTIAKVMNTISESTTILEINGTPNAINTTAIRGSQRQ